MAAIEAGFYDFDQMASDDELQRVRARGKIKLPKLHAFAENKGRNGVRMPYELILPEGYDAERTYPAVAVYAPGNSGPLASSWALENLCDGVTRKQDCIVLLLVTPERGWYTHPTHHALEDLFKKVLKEHKIAGNKFHLAAFGTGADAASTYAGMSRRYFQSFNIFSGQPFADDGQDAVTEHKGLALRMFVSSEDPAGIAEARRAEKLMKAAGGEALVRIMEEQPLTLPSLHHGGWLVELMHDLRAAADGGDGR